jgi:hypothetical protein
MVEQVHHASTRAFEQAVRQLGRAEKLAQDADERMAYLERRIVGLERSLDLSTAGPTTEPERQDETLGPGRSDRLEGLMGRSRASLGDLRAVLGFAATRAPATVRREAGTGAPAFSPVNDLARKITEIAGTFAPAL